MEWPFHCHSFWLSSLTHRRKLVLHGYSYWTRGGAPGRVILAFSRARYWSKLSACVFLFSCCVRDGAPTRERVQLHLEVFRCGPFRQLLSLHLDDHHVASRREPRFGHAMYPAALPPSSADAGGDVTGQRPRGTTAEDVRLQAVVAGRTEIPGAGGGTTTSRESSSRSAPSTREL